MVKCTQMPLYHCPASHNCGPQNQRAAKSRVVSQFSTVLRFSPREKSGPDWWDQAKAIQVWKAAGPRLMQSAGMERI
jgi:hypothetical protein